MVSMSFEENQLFQELDVSLTEAEADIRVEEREKRQLFIERTRGVLLRLLGYPEGLVNVQGPAVNKAFHVEGMDQETYVRVWTREVLGSSLLHVAHVQADFNLHTLEMCHQDMAMHAFSGCTYKYKQSMMTLPAGAEGPRSVTMRQEVGLPLRKAAQYDDNSDRSFGDGGIASYPGSSIIRLNDFSGIPLMEEAAMRKKAHDGLLPIIERLQPRDLIDFSR